MFDFDNKRDREHYDNWKTTEPEQDEPEQEEEDVV